MKEKELVQDFLNNLHNVKDWFPGVISVQKEATLIFGGAGHRFRRINKGRFIEKPRVDILLTHKDGSVSVIEAKAKHGLTHCVTALSQALISQEYFDRIGNNKVKYYILIPKMRQEVLGIIEKYNMPIDVIIWNNKEVMLCQKRQRLEGQQNTTTLTLKC